MMIFEVIKGTDDEIEFKGFKGRYFTRLVVFILSLILVTFFLYSIGLNSFLFFLIALIAGIGGFFYLRMEMEKNKKFGHIHKKHLPPKNIIQDKPFYQFVKK